MVKFAFRSVKYLVIIAALGAAGYFYFLPKSENAKNEKIEKDKQSQQNEYLIVTKVIDGDTFKMSNGEKVRLLGIDTPEKFDSEKLNRETSRSGKDKETIKKLGEAASEYVRKLVEGKKVKLVKEPGGDDKDKYGRSLRYVYSEDGTFINAKIIEDGYANVFNSSSISKSKMDQFRKLETEARESKRGLWGEGF